MAKVPPSQKFRLQPQAHKAAVAAVEQFETASEKTMEAVPQSNNVAVPGSLNVIGLSDRERSAAAVAQAKNERGWLVFLISNNFHLTPVWVRPLQKSVKVPHCAFRVPKAWTVSKHGEVFS